MGKDRDVDAVLRKCAGVLGQAEPCEPIGYFLHRRPRPADFGLVDPLDGRFYPIDRLARNRPKRPQGGRAQPEEPPTPAESPGRAIGAVQVLQTLSVPPCSPRRETTMATSAERMRALRERERRGLRRLTIDVSETDLQAIAERGSEGAASTDHDQEAQAVGLFLTDALVQI
jgi:hypothetical protein